MASSHESGSRYGYEGAVGAKPMNLMSRSRPEQIIWGARRAALTATIASAG